MVTDPAAEFLIKETTDLLDAYGSSIREAMADRLTRMANAADEPIVKTTMLMCAAQVRRP